MWEILSQAFPAFSPSCSRLKAPKELDDKHTTGAIVSIIGVFRVHSCISEGSYALVGTLVGASVTCARASGMWVRVSSEDPQASLPSTYLPSCSRLSPSKDLDGNMNFRCRRQHHRRSPMVCCGLATKACASSCLHLCCYGMDLLAACGTGHTLAVNPSIHCAQQQEPNTRWQCTNSPKTSPRFHGIKRQNKINTACA